MGRAVRFCVATLEPMYTASLRPLRYLQLVVAHGSFRAAGLAAGISQPAISQAMQRLEREWCIPLFEKEGRRKRPTAQALRVLDRLAEIGNALESLATQPADDCAERATATAPSTSTLTVGMAPAAAALYGPVIEEIWRSHHPEGKLQVINSHSEDMLAALDRSEIDLVIAPQSSSRPSAGRATQSLHAATPVLCARAGHPLTRATSLAQVVGAGWAVESDDGAGATVIREALRARRLPLPGVRVECSDYPALFDVVARSDLLCVVPHPVLLPCDDPPRIVPLRIQDPLPHYDVSVSWQVLPRRKVAAAVMAIIRVLTALPSHMH
ncbi:LysR family transcriptional regulator [Pigmentiphaga litoralis]|uniref:LysR family transcriptional regulator n=1 Tax=Pigmentiphaga litoralis TaxID=516702 RepID=UPI003B42D256